MHPEDVIQSRTDPRGIITECNDTFVDYSGYALDELMGAPHSIIRHPEMPRSLFKLMWREIQAHREIFVFVKNLAKDGRHYWVVAQVMPEIARGEIVGYHSFRRCPSRRAVETFETLYRRLMELERRLGGDNGMNAALKELTDTIAKMGGAYDALVYANPHD
jgi:PAS domain S-box-containing protein